MAYWKLTRLLALLAVMVALLAAGIVGLVRGVPEAPYGYDGMSDVKIAPRGPSPFRQLRWYCQGISAEEVLHQFDVHFSDSAQDSGAGGE